MRRLYALGASYVAVCGLIVLSATRPTAVEGGEPAEPAVASATDAGAWFQVVKPFCNTLEAETRMRAAPPPAGKEGAGYGAACYALAGRIDRARETLLALDPGERGYAAWVVFNIGHPVADAGDDRSAGPMMELVLEFWPDNYMALYHAGMSEYALGTPDLARTHLRQFLALYQAEDGWRSNAREVLGRLGP